MHREFGAANTLPSSALHCLYAILRIADGGEPVTVRRIMRVCGWKSPNSVTWTLRRLVRAGLVAWEPGQRATIRPLCRVTLFMEAKG